MYSCNKYVVGSRISEAKFRQILKGFSLDSTASETTVRSGVSRPTVNVVYMLIRKRIYELTLKK